MKNFSVIQILRSFTPDEIKEFDKVVRSPFFGGSDYIVKFWNEIKRAYPGFDEKRLTRERIFKKLYPGKKYDDSVIRKFSSNLLKMAEKYLGIKRVDSDAYRLVDLYTAVELRERKLYNLYENKYRELNKYYDNSSVYEFNKLLDRHLLQIQQMNFVTDTNESSRNFPERMMYYEHIITYMLTILMQETTRIWVGKTVFNHEDDYNIAEEFLKYFKINDFLENIKMSSNRFEPLLTVNRLLMNMFKNDADIEHYYKCRDHLFAAGTVIPKKALRMYFIFLVNYCLSKSRYADERFRGELSSIADKMDEFAIIIDPAIKQVISPFFNVIADAYINAGQFDKAEAFIDMYSKYLQSENKNDTLNFTRASLFFEKGDFERSLYFVNLQEPQVDYDKINYRVLKLQIFYELDRWEEFYLQLDSTRQFVKSTKLLASRFAADALKFLSFIKRLHEIKENKSTDADELKLEIINSDNVINKDWLLQKLDKMIN